MINSSVAFPERCSSISLKIGSFWSLFLSHVLLVYFTGIFVSRYLLLLCFCLLFFIIFIVLFILWEFHIMSFDHIQFLLSSQLLPHPPPHPLPTPVPTLKQTKNIPSNLCWFHTPRYEVIQWIGPSTGILVSSLCP